MVDTDDSSKSTKEFSEFKIGHFEWKVANKNFGRVDDEFAGGRLLELFVQTEELHRGGCVSGSKGKNRQ